jgi:hypothetical protein
MPRIGRELALVAQAATLVYIYAGISQIAERQTSFYATPPSPPTPLLHITVMARKKIMFSPYLKLGILKITFTE